MAPRTEVETKRFCGALVEVRFLGRSGRLELLGHLGQMIGIEVGRRKPPTSRRTDDHPTGNRKDRKRNATFPESSAAKPDGDPRFCPCEPTGSIVSTTEEVWEGSLGHFFSPSMPTISPERFSLICS
jgi:hypothetical protein